jgi:hypothetical protein
MSYQVMLDCGLQVLVTGHLCEVRDNHGRIKFAGNHEEVANWTAERGVRGWHPPAQPTFPIEKLRVDPDDVVLLTPTQVRHIVKLSSDSVNFRARLEATARGRKIFMLGSYKDKGGEVTLYRCHGEMRLTTDKVDRDSAHARFKGHGFIVTASLT